MKTLGRSVRDIQLSRFTRNERRLMLDREAKARKTGNWGPWERFAIKKGDIGSFGWTAQIVACHRNACFCVLERRLPDGAVHLAVSSITEIRPTWWEMQRIKDELAGKGRTAVEVYPPAHEVIDAADMYHLWVLPADLPYSLWHDEEAWRETGRSIQDRLGGAHVAAP